MAYTVVALVAAASARQWRVTKGLDADDAGSITHGLGVAPILLPEITPESPSQAISDANILALLGIQTVTATVINFRGNDAVGSATSQFIVTAHLPIR